VVALVLGLAAAAAAEGTVVLLALRMLPLLLLHLVLIHSCSSWMECRVLCWSSVSALALLCMRRCQPT
jgi:hypothetical protein